MTASENRLSQFFLSAVLTRFPPSSGVQIGPVLDLGCASGLAYAALSDVPFGPFIGVDAAPLTQSLSGLRYAELHDTDPLAFLGNERRSFPLILAGELCFWFGPLDSLFAALAPRLAPDGAFIFSFDSMPPSADANEEWRLRSDGRYAHSKECVARAAYAAGLVPRHLHAELPHDQESASGTQRIAVLDRAADAG
jgi:predicted TPR repeat methyltransferase